MALSSSDSFFCFAAAQRVKEQCCQQGSELQRELALIDNPNYTPSPARHPWAQARYDFFSSILVRELDPRPVDVLDMGSGDGWFVEQLATTFPHARFLGVDPAYGEAQLEKLNHSTPGSLRFVSELEGEDQRQRFDLILLLEVLAHIERDRLFLNELVQEKLKAGGHVLLSVPAWPKLYTKRDAQRRHLRRYIPKKMKAIVESAGLEILRSGQAFHTPLMPRVANQVRERLLKLPSARGSHGPWDKGPWATRLVLTGLRADNIASHLFAGLRLPVPGLSWWALCRASK